MMESMIESNIYEEIRKKISAQLKPISRNELSLIFELCFKTKTDDRSQFLMDHFGLSKEIADLIAIALVAQYNRGTTDSINALRKIVDKVAEDIKSLLT